MALSAFDDKAKPPKAKQLATVLGEASIRWGSLLEHLEEHYAPTDEHWGFSGKKWGWGLRIRHKKRAILYMTPSHGIFYVGFSLGEKAVRAAMQVKFPKRIVEVIENAPKYAEGRGVRIEVRTDADLRWIHRLAAIKMGS